MWHGKIRQFALTRTIVARISDRNSALPMGNLRSRGHLSLRTRALSQAIQVILPAPRQQDPYSVLTFWQKRVAVRRPIKDRNFVFTHRRVLYLEQMVIPRRASRTRRLNKCQHPLSSLQGRCQVISGNREGYFRWFPSATERRSGAIHNGRGPCGSFLATSARLAMAVPMARVALAFPLSFRHSPAPLICNLMEH